MSRIVDNLIAFRVLTMLVKPFPETESFKLGLIDKNGKKLRDPKTEEEKDSYDYLNRLVFNMKKLINKLPGGDNKIKNLVAALYLIKEQIRTNSNKLVTEEELIKTVNLNIILAEETLMVRKIMEEGEGGGALTGQGQTTNSTEPTNKTTGPVSTQEPVIRKKKPPIVRRQSLKQIAVDLNQKAL
jgi:hypothetical protein